MNPITVIIATFNEEEMISDVLSGVSEHAPGAEIIVVHGGKDGTDRVASRWGREHPEVDLKVYRNFGDVGKGHAVKVGITLASHPIILQFDADLQFAPADIPAMVAPIEEDRADLVVGSRFMSGVDKTAYQASFFRDLGNNVLNGWISLLAGTKITDVTTGMKAWSAEAIWAVPFRDNRYVYEMEIVVRAARSGRKIEQIPVCYASRQGGASGHGTGLREFWSIARTGWMIGYRALLIRIGAW